jgi:outer membrane protein assembly factor BamD (BamD/ComL family)
MDGGCVRIRLIEPARYAVTRVAAFVLLAVALAACSLFDKDAIAPDEPADKLYNEGLFMLNSK